MKLIPLTASLLALALTTTQVNAQVMGDSQAYSTEQPAAVDVPVFKMPSEKKEVAPQDNIDTGLQVPIQVQEFLDDKRPLNELTDKELHKRSGKAQKFADLPGLPADTVRQLKQVVLSCSAELVVRQNGETTQAKTAPVEAATPESQSPVNVPAPALAPAQTSTPEGAAPIAQPLVNAPDGNMTGMGEAPQEVMVFLQDGRPLNVLSVDELAARASKARRLAKLQNLDDAMRKQLLGLSDAARNELASRTLSTQPGKRTDVYVSDPNQPDAPAALVQPPIDPTLAPPLPTPGMPSPNMGTLTNEAARVLGDNRPLHQLSPSELTARFMLARQYSKDMSLPDTTRSSLAKASEEARAELLLRDQNAAAPAAQKPVEQSEKLVVAPPMPAVDTGLLPPPAHPLGPPPAFVKVAPLQAVPETVAPVKADVEQARLLDGNVANPAAEAKATAYLQDQRSADQLSDDELRGRLDGIRDLMTGNELSRESERALREKLRAEREILRGRVARSEPADIKADIPPNVLNPDRQILPKESSVNGPDPLAKPDLAFIPKADIANNQQAMQQKRVVGSVGQGNVVAPPLNPDQQINQQRPRAMAPDMMGVPENGYVPSADVLNDRRLSDELTVGELRQRLGVYRNASNDRRYGVGQRRYWSDVMAHDQYSLQQRLLKQRQIRQSALEQSGNSYGSLIDDQDYDQRASRRDVYAAEVNDADIQDTLTAPPRNRLPRRYTVREVEAAPQLRAAVPRVEIDTVHFGFNESYVRPEEVNNLDRVGLIIERIVKSNPGEVFFVEGHTDAVGSAAANLALSRQRAEAVKKALTMYFVIPPKNLITVGYGERYLKIPTADPEQENRRVSISRATPLVGSVN